MIPLLQILAHIRLADIVEKGLIATGLLQQLHAHLKEKHIGITLRCWCYTPAGCALHFTHNWL
ncbi:hypothetical protein A7M48_22850 [Acinetobacter baumannii]|nr:hypothetical protein A7M48_22850 [Acinetobacter baumannii]